MVIGSGVSPTEFRRCVALIERKLCELATKFGVPDSECDDLDNLLRALPEIARSRARAMLNGIQVSAADDHAAMATAARYVCTLAEDIWEASPDRPLPGEPRRTGRSA
jgi:hypothetical protein